MAGDMQGEVNNAPADKSAGSTKSVDSTSLGEQVFANPQDFLGTLRTILPKASSNGTGDATMNDLFLYSQHGDNARDKAAALIAANHFEDIRNMASAYSGDSTTDRDQIISSETIRLDLDSLAGTIDADVKRYQQSDAFNAAGSAALATGLVGLAAISMGEVPPAAPVFGLAGFAVGVNTVNIASSAFSLPGAAAQEAKADQKLTASWPEINNGR